jgi:uncharacterized protein YukE
MPGQMTLDPEAVKAFAQYLLQQRENIQAALQEADTRMAETVEAAYNTPGSETKFKPFWEEYMSGARQQIDGIEGMSQFLDQTLQRFVETDDATAGAIG